MIIKKTTASGEKTYSTGPMPDELKQNIRDAFGTRFDDCLYLKWVTLDTDPNYVGLDIYGSIEIPINGELDCYYRAHLHLDTATIEYEVYAFGEVPTDFPDQDALAIMATSPVFLGSLKTDSAKQPVEYTVYYKKIMCDPAEYALLRERVEFPCENGFGIGVKATATSTIYEEYANA